MFSVQKVIETGKWYLKYRTQIWSTVFMLIGIVGGSAITIQSYIPTLKYNSVVIENKLKEINEISKNLKKLQIQIDNLTKMEYNMLSDGDETKG
jgi:hypothetical protein